MNKVTGKIRAFIPALLTSVLLLPVPAIPVADPILVALQGCWQGKAIKTPRGALPYPICFELQRDSSLYGVADLDVSRHHWHFSTQEDKTQLRFLSTFAGNDTPIYLSASHTATEHMIFEADNSRYLKVRILQQEERTYRFTIEVKGKEHVIIVLTQKER
ncbi:hypothetical protein BIT28_22745 [Photobacterium proteolyticum]|uniref:DUF1579 domain-containing protein n=1 Tax=Photobacterium proteolyticum TaxID=1903952 RepID=A0A1Q9GLP0_9GAMM|nr:hypothetical protein [Photobacterium proteolyticum]OLQ75459.1 hypothetical protein BIT28_22745 [Photobacterium proteolyticum]